MKIELLTVNGAAIAVISGEEKRIFDTQSALDLAMTVKYETGAEKIVLDKNTNYPVKMAVYGDFSHYTSRPLKDFIYESNRGKDFFFFPTKEEAIRHLAAIS